VGVRAFHDSVEPFVTGEAVISECFFLLERLNSGKQALCGLLENEIVRVQFESASEMKPLLALIRQYADTP
jgi:hypothetical protein